MGGNACCDLASPDMSALYKIITISDDGNEKSTEWGTRAKTNNDFRDCAAVWTGMLVMPGDELEDPHKIIITDKTGNNTDTFIIHPRSAFPTQAATNSTQITNDIIVKWKEQERFIRFVDGDKTNCSVANLKYIDFQDALAHWDDWIFDWDMNLTPNEIDCANDPVWRATNYVSLVGSSTFKLTTLNTTKTHKSLKEASGLFYKEMMKWIDHKFDVKDSDVKILSLNTHDGHPIMSFWSKHCIA